MKTILGLDLGPSSIGWALINTENEKPEKIIKAGSRIIPMDAKEMSDYESGKLQSAASLRTGFRGMRRLYERASLRRERLLRVLNILGFLPCHYKNQIDFETHPGKFKDNSEPLLPYKRNENGKSEFVFQSSFLEMLEDFKKDNPEVLVDDKLIPYDWTIYYCRKKALYAEISRGELAWILLNANSKRGYYQLDEESDERVNEKKEYCRTKVINVEKQDEDRKQKGYYFYEITYENGLVQKRKCKMQPWRVGDEVDLIVTTPLDDRGKPKVDEDGNIVRRLSSPKEDDWGLVMKKTQAGIDASGGTVGEYIYGNLVKNPSEKVKGGFVKTIERHYYKDEIRKILESQKRFIPELNDAELYMKCVKELYRNNEAHVNELSHKNIVDFIINDVIYYQRPLKSKKSCIADCPYESYNYVDSETGEVKKRPLKVMPKSHPLFQEFRLWQFIHNLRITENERTVDNHVVLDYDVTMQELGTPEQVCDLYDKLSSVSTIKESAVLKALCLNPQKYKWNFGSTEFPGLKTHHSFVTKIEKLENAKKLSSDEEEKLWHILYSVSDRDELEKALKHFAEKCGYDKDKFYELFKSVPQMRGDYASYSKKAVKRLLSLMRTGRYWSADEIDKVTRARIEKHIAENTVLEDSFGEYGKIEDFQYLRLSDACYVVYGRHSENADNSIWESPEDIDKYIAGEFRKNSMRNPVVEKVVGETLKVVRDIWKTYGKPAEIHVEMARSLKEPNDKREEMTKKIAENRKKNLELRQKLQELKENGKADNVNPNSSMHMLKYKLWEEQNKQSPYTRKSISIAKLFTSEYEIDHIIPQKRYFDDSFTNKVVCESAVNKDKGARLSYEYLLAEGGKEISLGNGEKVTLKTAEEFEAFVENNYSSQEKARKRKNLMRTDVPASFNASQLNNTRYIARKTAEILSHIVREEDDQGSRSKNIIMTNGSITDRLKKDWGLKQTWNDMMRPRFERLNDISQSNDYGEEIDDGKGKHYFQTRVPEANADKFDIKRIDHRHHAMDAIVIACTSLNHINYMNNESGGETKRYDLKKLLCEGKDRQFTKPWETFTQDSRKALDDIVVSFKQNLRIVSRASNYYYHYVDGKKVLTKQTKGDSLSIRKPLHKATYSGLVRLPITKNEKIENTIDNPEQIVDKTIRKELKKILAGYNGSADKKKIKKYFKDRDYKLNGKDVSKVKVRVMPENAEYSSHRTLVASITTQKQLESITDTGIKKILQNHLENYGGNFEEAFSPEGISSLNDNIKLLNGGRDHKPIKCVRVSEKFSTKFPVRQVASKSKSYVEAEKGTNLFFAIYVDEEGKRVFETIPLIKVVESKKLHLSAVPECNASGNKLLFSLSPGDLVYVPEEDEHITLPLNTRRIYKMVSTGQSKCFFIPQSIATPIEEIMELGSNNKSERAWDGIQIKKVCLKLETDRLGNIVKVIGHD